MIPGQVPRLGLPPSYSTEGGGQVTPSQSSTRLRGGSPSEPCTPPPGKWYIQYQTYNGQTEVFGVGGGAPRLDIPQPRPIPGAKYTCIFVNPTKYNQPFMFGTMRYIITGIVAAGAAITGAGVAGILGGLGAGISGAAGAIGTVTQGAIAGASGVTGSILNIVDSVAGEIKNLISPITSVVTDISSVVNRIDTQVIEPIVNPIKTIADTYNGVIAEIHSDIKEGLQGLIKIPGQIADALSGVDASFQRASQQAGLYNRQTVQEFLTPGIAEGVGVPIQDMHQTFKDTFEQTGAAAFAGLTDSLKPETVSDSLTTILETIRVHIEKLGWPWKDILTGVWDAAYSIEYVLKYYEIIGRKYINTINSEVTPNLLDVSTVIEAERRGIITNENALAELAALGFDKTRHDAFYDVAQYLFSPVDTVNLLARGAIDKATFTKIMNQNNLDSGQATALQDLLRYLFSPGEIATLYYRTLIDDTQYKAYMDANKVSSQDQDYIKGLAVKPIDGRSLLTIDGRTAARENNFLPESLGTKVSQAYKDLYSINMLAIEQAEIDWLRHWQIPSNDFWVMAYWRGVRTLDEVHEAFRANNTPPELWDDIFKVNEELPPVWLVPDVIATGVWTEEAALQAFQKLGFSPANAKILYNYGVSKGSVKAKAAADTLHGLSVSNATLLYDNNVIDEQEYTNILLDHGIGTEAAKLTVEVAKVKADILQRKEYLTYVIDRVRLGQISEETATSDLANKGYTSQEITIAMTKMKRQKTVTSKLPTEAQLNSMVNKGIILPSIWQQTMVAIGYSQEWINYIFTDVTGLDLQEAISLEGHA